MSYPHLFLHGVTTVRIRREQITVNGKPREFVTLTIGGHRAREQWTITLEPGSLPFNRIQIIEEKEAE